MRYVTWFLVLGTVVGAWAGPSGGFEAKAEQGRLTAVSSWWKPAPDWQGRWWWREGAGSAWVRAGGFQMGPLIVTSGGDGWRRWYPGTTLSSGYWGLGFDGGPWGVWAVQRPETLEAGAQLGLASGSVSAAVGGDRTWPLEPPARTDQPWSDRVRAGLTWDDGVWLAGVEHTALLPADGSRGWRTKGHASFDAGPWFGGVRAERDQEPGAAAVWTASSAAGWEAWSVRWSQVQGRPPRWEGRWADDARCWDLNWGAEAETAYHGGWSLRGGVSVSGDGQRGRWLGAWAAAPSGDGIVQTVTAAWREASLEASARWRVEGQRLGWFGPGSEMTLTVRRLF